MSNIIAFLAANWLMLCIALAFLIFLVAGVSWAISWYFWKLVIEAHEPKPLPDYAPGDVIKVPPDYWNRVADADHAKAKRRAG